MPPTRRQQYGKEYVLKTAQESDVKFIRLWFTDILGRLKSFAITIGQLEEALEEGMGFDGSSIEGFSRADEADMIAMPDPNTFELLPWRPQEKSVARLFCDVLRPNRRPFEGDPRYVLKQNLARAAKLGYTFYVGPELEYFYFKSSASPEPLDDGGYFDMTPMDAATDLRRETILAMEQMGVEIEYSHHEAAPSQHEIDFRYTDALTMADNVMTYRLVVKEIALKHGVYATFMPKPLSDQNGSGMHTHMSLFDGEKNAFYDPKDKQHLSRTAKYFLAGILRHAKEFTLVTNQWVNSYKRLVPGYEAPLYVSWAERSVSELVRVPVYQRGKANSVRFELRSPDPACNPYLAFSVLLAAGLRGVQQRYQLPMPVTGNGLTMTDADRKKQGIEGLPGNLYEAIRYAEDSELLREALGPHVHRSFIENKRIEWDRYCRHVSDYELSTYLPQL